jgi:hypothetical protein
MKSPKTRPNVPTTVANKPILMKELFKFLGVVWDIRLVFTPSITIVDMNIIIKDER